MLFQNTSQQINSLYDAELARAMEYEQVGPDGDKTDSDFVKFDAFFLRDVNNDGYAESIRGTCREITQTDTLYINLKVLSNGKLKNGKIEIQGQNINFKTALVEDNVIAQNYISENTTQINLKEINNGTQKLIYGTIKAPNFGNDTKKYSSKINKIILTGEHESNDGQTKTIRKEVDFTIDWYASVNCSIYNYSSAQNIEDVLDEAGRKVNLSFYITTKETKELAILKTASLKGKLPAINGELPTNVEITGTDLKLNYTRETGEFEVTRTAEKGDNGIVTNPMSRTNTYRFNVTYPYSVYESLGRDTINISVPVEAYYEGYNNENPQFDNPVKSNVATTTVSFLWRKYETQGTIRVENFDVKVGEYRSYDKNYVISKKEPLKLYDEISEETEDLYTVKWSAFTGERFNMESIELKEQDDEQNEDRFQDTGSTFHGMSEFTNNIGIYFTGANTTFGEEGKIDVYDAESSQLIHTFTKSDWNIYNSSNPYRYETPVKHIKVQTSKANKNSSFTVYSIKEINDNALKEQFLRPQFDNLQRIYSYLQVNIKENVEGEYINRENTQHYALYEAPITVATVDIYRDTFGTQKEEKDVNITISTNNSTYFNMEQWTNGTFLVKMPKQILDVTINRVDPSDGAVNILAYEVVEKEIDNDKVKFIKIETENETPKAYTITINCNLIADPRIPTQKQNIELYAINENCYNYETKQADTYDVDGDGNVAEQVNYATDQIELIAPSSLLTNQQAVEYNNAGETAIAPQIATIDKEQVNTAKVNVNITNNYSGTISEIKILGKIPFTNNKYSINNTDLGSMFNTTMVEEITVPADLQATTTVYYSEEINPTTDIEDVANGWKPLGEIGLANVRSYLIDLGSHRLNMKEERMFSYEIQLPKTVKYNDVSYSTHAVYFCLDTDGGKFKTETEPTKLGFKIERKYDLSLKKFKEDTENVLVQGATFAVLEDGQTEGKIGTTNENGTFTIENLYVDKTYTLKEIRTPSAYEKNTMEYKFKVTVNEDSGDLEIQDISGQDKLKSKSITQAEETNRGVLNVEVENTPKYKIVLIKKEKDSEETLVKGAKYNLKGGTLGDAGITISTDSKGKLTISGLQREVEYTLTEISAKGYYVDKTPITFKVTKADGTVKFSSESEAFTNTPKLEIGQEVFGLEAQDTVQMELEDEKIPTYSVTLKKYAKGEDRTLEGAQYKIEGEGIEDGGETYITGEEGTLTIEGLYEYVETKPDVTGEYTITEITPPEGYSLNPTPLKFKAERKEENENKLDIEILSGGEGLIRMVADETAGPEETKTKQDITITSPEDQNAIIQIGLIDEPLFKITKKEKDTELPIPNTKFKLVEIDETYGEVGPAEDTTGNPVGEEELINGKQERVVTTDENGVISYGLRSGLYKAIEVQAVDGYVFIDEETSRTYYFGIGKSKAQETEQGVAWANEVAGEGWNKVEAVEKTKDEGTVIAGYYTNAIDLDGDGKEDLTGALAEYAGFIAKFGTDGTLKFAKKITSGSEVKALDIVQTQDEGYAVVGYFSGSNLKVNEVQTNLTDTTKYEKGFVIKFTKDGEYVWSAEIADASQNVNAVCAVEDTNRNIIVGANTDGNPKIEEYNDEGTSQHSTTITASTNIEDMVTKIENDGVIVVSSDKTVSTSSTTGRIDTYSGGSVTDGITTEFNPVAIIKLSTGKYIIAGNYMGTAIDVASNGSYYDGIIVEYNGQDISNAKYVRGSNDDIITSIDTTEDGGFIVSAYTHSSKVDFTNDNTNQVSSILGTTDAILIKYNGEGNYESYKQMQGSDMEQITDVVETKKDEYVAVGYFNSKTVNANKPVSSSGTDLALTKNSDGFILTYGEKVTAPEVPEKSSIDVENELKEYTITTEVKQLDGKEKGGTITGGENPDVPVETVQHGKDSKGTITVEPESTYKILSITVNDEEYPFTPEAETGKFTFPKFENMTSNKHIVVTFSNTVSSVTVHHYLDGTESEDEPKQVAPDETKVGEIGTDYTTEPHTELDKYELKKEGDDYVLPLEKSGQFAPEPKTVTYLYVEKKVPLTVHHYLEGTTNPVTLANGAEASDEHQEGEENTDYTTQSLKDFYTEEEVGDDKKLAAQYELSQTPLNAEGKYSYPQVEVTYEYKVKEYEITTSVKTHGEQKEVIGEEGDVQTQEVQVAGGTINGEGYKPYETVEHGQNSTLPIVATPAENYQVKDVTVDGKVLKAITKNGVQLQENEYSVDEETGVVTVNELQGITSNIHIEVEFEKIPAKVIVHHYIYDKATKAETEIPVKLLGGDNAPETTIDGKIGDMYATEALKNEEIQEGYELYKEAENSSGYMTKAPIDVKYYYALKGADMVQSVVKDGTQIITSKDEELNYTIKYTAQIKSYKGNAEITIVDTLPYALDKEKMKEIATQEGKETSGEEEWLKEFLDNGEYAEIPDEQSEVEGAKIYTITWHETREGIETDAEELAQVDPIEITKNIRVVFKGISTKQPQSEAEKIFTNKVKATIKLNATGQEEETKETTHDTKMQFVKNLKVTKTWNDGKNTYGRPTKVEIQVKEEGKPEVVDKYTLTQDDNWTHTFTGLRKYDDEGNEIKYTVEEAEADGESLDYYEREK